MAAVAAALIVCCPSGTLTHAQTTQAETGRKPLTQAQTERKPAAPAQSARKPQPAAKQGAQPPTGKQAEQSSGESVCVAAMIGHKFHVQKIGLMVFGNSLDEVATDAWGIDEASVRKIQEILGKQFAVRRLAFPKAALDAYEAPGGLFRNPNAELLTALRAAAGTSKCAFYVVLTRGANSFGGTNQSVAGLGIVDRANVLMDQIYLFANYYIQLYDGDNFTLLKQAKPSVHPLLVSGLVMPSLYAMYRQVDKSWWPATPQAAAQSAQLKNATRALVEEGLAKTLPEMFKPAEELPATSSAAHRD